MKTYSQIGGPIVKLDPEGRDVQTIYEKNGVTVRSSAALKPGILFTVTTVGEYQTKNIDIYFRGEPTNGSIGVTDAALAAILKFRFEQKQKLSGGGSVDSLVYGDWIKTMSEIIDDDNGL
jgi:hypothetical protein